MRTRRTMGRVVLATGIAAGAIFWMDLQGRSSTAEGQTPAAGEEASVGGEASAGTAPDVGVWAVEGSQVPEGAGDPGDATDGQPTDVRVVVKGKDHDVTTNAVTVRQLLSAMGIEPDRNDRVTPPPSTPISKVSRRTGVTFVDIRIERVERTRPVAPETQTVYTNSLEPGQMKIIHDGRPGKAEVTIIREVHDGKLIRSRVAGERVVRKPKPRVKAIGKDDPEPVVPAEGSGGSSGGGSGGQSGTATWYERSCMCAAHPTLPFGTVVKVTASNGRSVTVVINDRGPFGSAIIDLSDDAFAQLAPLSTGVINVHISW